MFYMRSSDIFHLIANIHKQTNLTYQVMAKTYEVCPASIQLCNMKNRHIYWRRYKIQETLYIGQWHLSPLQSRHLGTSHSFPSISSTFKTLQNPLLESPSAALSHFPESCHWSEISSLPKVILVLRKARSLRTLNLGCEVAESPWRFDVSPKNPVWDGMPEWARCCDEDASHQLPIAVAIFIAIHHISQLMKNIEVVSLLNVCTGGAFLWWTTLSQSKNTVNVVLILLRLCHAFFGHGEPDCFHWDDWAFISGS